MVFSELRELKEAADKRRYLALRPGTHANHSMHLLTFLRFCISFELSDFPASDSTLCMFAEFLLRSYKAPKSVLNVLSSIKFYHSLKNFDISGFNTFKFLLTKQAISKSVRHSSNSATPMTKKILKDICRIALSRGDQGLAFASLCVVAFFALARLSSLVPEDIKCIDISKVVALADVRPHQLGLQVRIRWSKTDQCSQRGIVVPILASKTDGGLCPVVILSSLIIKLSHCEPLHTPLFTWCKKNNNNALQTFSMASARSWLTDILRVLGLSQKGFTFHSFRRGGCHEAYRGGATVADLKFMGNWKSDAINLYLPAKRARLRAALALN